MKVETVQILWHGGEPVLSVHRHPTDGQRMATAGADKVVRIWKVDSSGPKISVEFVSALRGHTKTVNTVKFAPNGELLASAGDDGVIILWKKMDTLAPRVQSELADDQDESQWEQESWRQVRSLRGHPQDVYDISWSPTSEFLLSGSLDHTAIVWDLSGAQPKQSQWLNQHTHYVQGVAWDPFDEMIATQSCDRTVKIYKRPVTAYATAAAPIPAIKAADVVVTAATASSDVQSAEGNAAAEAAKPKPKTVNKLGTFVPVASLARRRFDSARSSKKASAASQSASTTSVSATAATAATVATEPAPVPAADDDESDQSDMEDIADAENADRKTPQTHQLFLDETVQTFFRRLDWSPDGMLLATPTGQYFDQPAPTESEVQPGKAQQALYLFHRGDFARPLCHCAGFKQPALIVRFSPILYARRQAIPAADSSVAASPSVAASVPSQPATMLSSPYRMVFAVAMAKSIVFFDTEQMTAFSLIKDVHYLPITDLAWSADGLQLTASSNDGYCTVVAFGADELGRALSAADPEYPWHMRPGVRRPPVSLKLSNSAAAAAVAATTTKPAAKPKAAKPKPWLRPKENADQSAPAETAADDADQTDQQGEAAAEEEAEEDQVPISFGFDDDFSAPVAAPPTVTSVVASPQVVEQPALPVNVPVESQAISSVPALATPSVLVPRRKIAPIVVSQPAETSAVTTTAAAPTSTPIANLASSASVETVEHHSTVATAEHAASGTPLSGQKRRIVPIVAEVQTPVKIEQPASAQPHVAPTHTVAPSPLPIQTPSPAKATTPTTASATKSSEPEMKKQKIVQATLSFAKKSPAVASSPK